MKRRFAGLWHHPDFMKLWIGQTISEFGSRITRDALPLTALVVLGATPAQMSLLVAFSSLPVLILGLLIGAWVDRLRRRPIMLGADLLRLLILLAIPFSALAGQLRIELVYVVAALTGILGLLFEAAYRAFLPTLIAPEQLIEGNGKLATTDSLAEIGGPTLAGILVQLISAPLAIFFDAVSFLFSALSVALIRKPEPAIERANRGSVRAEVVEGIRFISGTPTLRVLAIGIAARSFFGSFFAVLYSLYALRDLALTPALLGIAIASGGVGALVGAMLSERIIRRFGFRRALTGSLLVGSVVGLVTPLAGGPAVIAVLFLIFAQLVNDGAMVIFAINELSYRQMITPARMLGRVNASLDFLSQGIAVGGALVGGALAGLLGARLTLLIATLSILATALWMRGALSAQTADLQPALSPATGD